MQKTDIEWTDFSANPLKYRRKSDGKVVWACIKTSPGCAHCYSEAVALRFERGKLFNAKNMEELEPFLDLTELKKMLTAKTIQGHPVSGSRCFVGDMTDLFGEWVVPDLLNRLFSGVLEARPDVTWQLLTKRAKRMHEYLSWRWGDGRIPSRNIHVGVSVEDQQRADERILLLLQTPAAVRFLSVEPLLGPVDLPTRYLCGRCNPLLTPGHPVLKTNDPNSIHWVIVGGESGKDARPCDVAWIRSIVRQCKAAGVSCFVKQLGSHLVVSYYGSDGNDLRDWGSFIRLKLRDRKGGSPEEWPVDLRIREFPGVSV